MTTSSESLNEQIARAMGWRIQSHHGRAYQRLAPNADYPYERWDVVPDFAHSLDAIKGAEKVLVDAGGWWLEVKYQDVTVEWFARWHPITQWEYAPTEEEARAHAALSALSQCAVEEN